MDTLPKDLYRYVGLFIDRARFSEEPIYGIQYKPPCPTNTGSFKVAKMDALSAVCRSFKAFSIQRTHVGSRCIAQLYCDKQDRKYKEQEERQLKEYPPFRGNDINGKSQAQALNALGPCQNCTTYFKGNELDYEISPHTLRSATIRFIVYPLCEWIHRTSPFRELRDEYAYDYEQPMWCYYLGELGMEIDYLITRKSWTSHNKCTKRGFAGLLRFYQLESHDAEDESLNINLFPPAEGVRLWNPRDNCDFRFEHFGRIRNLIVANASVITSLDISSMQFTNQWRKLWPTLSEQPLREVRLQNCELHRFGYKRIIQYLPNTVQTLVLSDRCASQNSMRRKYPWTWNDGFLVDDPAAFDKFKNICYIQVNIKVMAAVDPHIAFSQARPKIVLEHSTAADLPSDVGGNLTRAGLKVEYDNKSCECKKQVQCPAVSKRAKESLLEVKQILAGQSNNTGKTTLKRLFISCGQFSAKLTGLIGLQLIDHLEKIHTGGELYGNIRGGTILVDMKGVHLATSDGARLRYCSEDGIHYTYEEGVRFGGNPRYASLSRHSGIRRARSDDMESMCLVLLHYLIGDLPWIVLKKSNSVREGNRCYNIMDYKHTFFTKERSHLYGGDWIYKDVPSEFASLLQDWFKERYQRRTDFLKTIWPVDPEYDRVRRVFRSMAGDADLWTELSSYYSNYKSKQKDSV